MRVSRFGLRAIGFGLVFAMAGFAFAMATHDSPPLAPGLASRAIGSFVPLRFTTPTLQGSNGQALGVQEYDLGDALFGSSIVRFITAEGGVRPYRFTSIDSKTTPPVLSLANAILNTNSTLILGISGVVNGNTPLTIAPNSKTFNGAPGLHFHVVLTDSNESNAIAVKGTYSNQQMGNFNLALFDRSTTPFRFAIDTLPVARLDDPYFAQIDVLGGRNPVVISALSVTDTSTGLPVRLANLGLFVAPNGSIYGRPLKFGTFAIVAHATDGTGGIARSRRDPNVIDQALTLNVLDNRVTTSDTMTQSCIVKGDIGSFDRDTLTLKGLINVLGQDQFNLTNSEFEFQLGGITISGRLDKNGKLVQRNPDGSRISVAVNARTGTITIRASASFIRLFNLTNIFDGDFVLRPIKIVVGSAVNSTEVLQFFARTNGTAYTFTFVQGRTGSNVTGGFQVVSVKGRDTLTLTGQPGDAWRAGFVAQPRVNGIVGNPQGLREGIDNITAINVRVGAAFSQALTGGKIIGAGPKINFRGLPTDGIQTFNFSTKTGKGTVNTRPLSSVATGIPVASSALQFNNVFFPLGLDFIRTAKDATFIGEHARRIFGFGSTYTDKPSRRQTPPIF